ncbi:hypothetical protein TNCV_1467511 [Trichonephila clavipes]|uniref:Uncharacterized protein n=1 Tax=Trichonephila clavipes TaxID=2585209 RepID=A0A8X6V740_TRICX|nr:hypothetical protein TNCV_1467511 [Trichonephila clavipes]
MIPAYNKMRCAAFPFETGIPFRRKTDFFPEEDTTKSYSGFEPESTRLQAEGHSHNTGWATPRTIRNVIKISPLHPTLTPSDLWTALQDSWCQLPPALHQTLIESMPRRVEALLRARWGPARY